MQLGDPATQRAGQLLSALRSGQGTAVNEALKSLIDALSGRQPPPLNDEERAEVASILKQIAQATHDKGLSAQLDKAGDAVQNQPTGPDAARPLEELRNPLVARVERERAEKMLISTIRAALADVARKAEMQTRPMLVPSAGADPTTSDDGGTSAMGQRLASPDDEEPPSAADDPEARGQGGNGAGTATASQLGGGTAEKPNTGRDERVTAPWVGAAVSQLVSAGSSGDEKARDAGRELLGAQQRALEQDVRREEIPAEYAQAIRRYFFNVQKDWERQWKSTK